MKNRAQARTKIIIADA